ncbi:MAG: carboxypeptidase-like regulatory domain-containing protein [Gemmataceae bacterium]
MKYGSSTPLAAARAPRPPRPLAVFGSVLLLACVFLTLGGMLAFVGPSEDPLFIPLWIADADSMALAEMGRMFPRGISIPTVPDRAALIQRLDALREASVSDAVVVFVHGPATLNDEGKVCLLPADAVADQPQTWLPLQEVLARLKRCASRNQLLLVEFTLPHGKLASVACDPSSFLERELEAAPDPRRTVVSSDGALPAGIVHHRLGRSPFVLAVELALAGNADSVVDGRQDGRIGTQEMTAFVQTHVPRIADAYGAAANVRVHGERRDFTLASLTSRGVESVALPTQRELPTKLRELWLQADELQKRTDIDVRQLQRIRHSLLEAEAKRRLQPPGKLGDADVTGIEKSLTVLREVRPLELPLTFSQAQENLGEPSRLQAIRNDMTNAYRDLATVGSSYLPKEYERWTESLAEKWRQTPPAVREAAIFEWAVQDTRHNLEAIRFADFVARKLVAEEPRTPEALALRQLADLAHRGVDPWPIELAGHWLRTARSAEQFAISLEGVAALRNRWIEAEELRRRAEVRLLAFDYSSPVEALRLAAEADRQFESLLRDARILEKARHQCSEACRLLLALEPAAERKQAWHPLWLDLAEKTQGLRRVMPGNGGGDPAAIHAETSKLIQAISTIREMRLREIEFVVAKQAQAAFDSKYWESADALLASDLLSAGERGELQRTLPRRDLSEHSKPLDPAAHELVAALPAPVGLRESDQRRFARKIAWCRVAGLSPDALTIAQGKMSRLIAEPSDSIALQDLLRTMRQVEQVDLPTRFAAAKSPTQREQLAWAVADEAGSPWMERRQDAIRTWQAVQADRFRARVHDFRGIGLETPMVTLSRRFASRIADALGDGGGAGDDSILMKSEPLARSLHSGHLQSTFDVEIQPVVARLAKTAIETTVSFDGDWLSVSPARLELNELRRPEDPPFKATMQVRLRPEAESKPHTAPRGFLLQSICRGLAYHRAVEVPLEAAAQPVKILISENPKEPTSLAEEIRLRPGKVRQSFFVYLKNMEDKRRPIRVEFAANDHSIAGSMQELVLEPREVRKAPFMAEGELADFQGPLLVRVIDPEKNIRLAWRQIRVAVASPRDYVRIADIRSTPSSDGSKLEVQLVPTDAKAGFSIEAELRSGDVVAATSKIPASLVAHPLPKSAVQNPVFVTVDGVPRSFIVHAGYAELPQPRTDDRMAVRLKAPAVSQPQAKERIIIEVDNAPAAANLELSLIRPGSGTPHFELVRRFNSPRQNRVRVRAGADGGLVFDAAIEDWSLTIDTTPFQGPRILKARLLDELGRELQQAIHEWTFDHTPPNDLRFLDIPKQAKRGSTLPLQFAAADVDSEIEHVVVFRGRPVDQSIPPGVEVFVGRPAPGLPGKWAVLASLSPDARGPTPLSVKATNRAGLSRFETAVVDVLDVDPETLRVGKIQGKVSEGTRPQPNLIVILKHTAGKDAARVRTQSDGTFQFDGVLPGSYRLEVAKPESGRRANAPVDLAPGGLGTCDLHLSL